MRRKRLDFLLLIIMMLIACLIGCETKKLSTESADYPVIRQGTYQMIMETDTTKISFDIELVTAVDSAVYGVIRSEVIDYEAPIALDSVMNDSLYFHHYTTTIAVQDQSGEMEGIVNNWRGNNHKVTIEKIADTASKALMNSRKMLPIKLDIAVPSFAWAAPKNSEALYFVSKNQIYLASLRDQIWQTEVVAYDTGAWKFYSVSLNSDQSKLIVHGRPKKEGLPHLGGGDYYELKLSNPIQVSEIKHLASISTSSYDIFPSYTSQDEILISTGGEFGQVKNKGRTDIFLAQIREKESFIIQKLDDDFNTELPEAGAFMDVQQRFILFYRKNFKKNLRDRIYISYRHNNEWSEPEVLGSPINRGFNWTYGPRIDPEGKFLFFNSGFRGRPEIFRVPTEEIPELKKYF